MNPAGEDTELASEKNTVELGDSDEADVTTAFRKAQLIGARCKERGCSYIPESADLGRRIRFPLRDTRMNLDKFFQDVDTVNNELKELQNLNRSLHLSHESSKNRHSAEAVGDMKANMVKALEKTKHIKVCLEKLDRSNVDSRGVEGCGPGSAVDDSRTLAVSDVRKYLKDVMGSFKELRDKISKDYRETMRRRYYSVTGENPDEECVDHLISTGESEMFLQKAIRERGRNRIVDTIDEIQETHRAFRDIEEKLKELDQVFLGMALEHTEAQGQPENNTKRRRSFWGRVGCGTSPKK